MATGPTRHPAAMRATATTTKREGGVVALSD
jgi:hypothetical protein